MWFWILDSGVRFWISDTELGFGHSCSILDFGLKLALCWAAKRRLYLSKFLICSLRYKIYFRPFVNGCYEYSTLVLIQWHESQVLTINKIFEKEGKIFSWEWIHMADLSQCVGSGNFLFSLKKLNLVWLQQKQDFESFHISLIRGLQTRHSEKTCFQDNLKNAATDSYFFTNVKWNVKKNIKSRQSNDLVSGCLSNWLLVLGT